MAASKTAIRFLPKFVITLPPMASPKTSKKKPLRSKKPQAKANSKSHRVNCLTIYLQAGIPMRKPTTSGS